MDWELDGQVALEDPDVGSEPMLADDGKTLRPNVRPFDVISMRIDVAP